MRIWTSLFIVGIAVSIFALDPVRLAMFESALIRHVPVVPNKLDLRGSGPPIGAAAERDLMEGVQSGTLAGEERLGAAELLWLSSLLGEGVTGESFQERFGVMLMAARDATDEASYGGLICDALGAHLALVGSEWNVGRRDESEAIARAAIDVALEVDSDNGWPLLIAAELSLACGRLEVARDQLLLASRREIVDPGLRRRAAAARTFLVDRGSLPVTAWEFLVGRSYSGNAGGHARRLDRIARAIGEHDAAERSLDDRTCLETFIAIHRAGSKLRRASLLVADAELAAEVGDSYLGRFQGATGSGVAGPDPSIQRRLMAAGFTDGAFQLDIDRREVEGLAEACRRLANRTTGWMQRTRQLPLVLDIHSLLVPWIGCCLLLMALFRGLLSFTRRPKKMPPEIGVGHVIVAFATPAFVLVYLGTHQLFPFDGTGPRSWIEEMGQVRPILYLAPLTSIPILLLGAVARKRERSLFGATRSLTSFYGLFASLLLLLFATSAAPLARQAELRYRAIDARCVEAYQEPGARD